MLQGMTSSADRLIAGHADSSVTSSVFYWLPDGEIVARQIYWPKNKGRHLREECAVCVRILTNPSRSL